MECSKVVISFHYFYRFTDRWEPRVLRPLWETGRVCWRRYANLRELPLLQSAQHTNHEVRRGTGDLLRAKIGTLERKIGNVWASKRMIDISEVQWPWRSSKARNVKFADMKWRCISRMKLSDSRKPAITQNYVFSVQTPNSPRAVPVKYILSNLELHQNIVIWTECTRC